MFAPKIHNNHTFYDRPSNVQSIKVPSPLVLIVSLSYICNRLIVDLVSVHNVGLLLLINFLFYFKHQQTVFISFGYNNVQWCHFSFRPFFFTLFHRITFSPYVCCDNVWWFLSFSIYIATIEPAASMHAATTHAADSCWPINWGLWKGRLYCT